MALFKSRMARAVTFVVGTPVVCAGGLAAYITYREKTKPQRVFFRPLVDKEGNLQLEGRVIPAPGKWTIFKRVLHLAFIFTPAFILYLLMCWNQKLYNMWLELFLKSVQRAGPVFVKIGQWSCTREDLFSPQFRKVFRRLYNEVDIHPYADTLKILDEELGKDALTVFDTIEPTTVGSGSIGQVHLAKLKDSEAKVVIKVMHPNIIETVVRDFAIINGAAEWAHWAFASLDEYDLPKLSKAFVTHLAAQLDFRIEAENLEHFRENFRQTNYVQFPKPLISTQRMLVETFCEGEPANNDFLASLPPHAREALANKGLNTWCQMLLRDNFIHGDMHPGNILIDCTDSHDPTITLIDVGLCQQLTEDEGRISHNLMESFVRWKSEMCAQSLWDMSQSQKYADREAFDADMEVLFKGFRSNRNDQHAVTNILQSIFECIRKHHVQMDPAFVSLLFAVLVLEGFIMNLDPNFNMVRHAAPWLVSEGHLSKGVMKNLARTQWDNLKRRYGIMTGRMEDSMELEKLEGHQNVRLSVSSW